MEAKFDAKALGTDLCAFRASVLFYLTDERPMPNEISEPLWHAYRLVAGVIAQLVEYGYEEAESGTYFLPGDNDQAD